MLSLVLPNGEKRQVPEGTCMLSLAKEFASLYKSPIVEGLYNGRLYDLQRPMRVELKDNTIGFVEVNTDEGMRAYVRTLLFMFLIASKRLYPEADIEVRNTLGSALYCVDKAGRLHTEADLKSVEAEMHSMVEKREPVELKILFKEDALEAEKGYCSEDRLCLMRQLPDDTQMSIYYMDDQPGYFFGCMCPDCGYVPNFELLAYDGGVIINYPDTGKWDVLPPFVKQDRLNRAFQEGEEWIELIKCKTIGELNAIVEKGYAQQIIQISEALHENKLADIARQIAARKDVLKLILIAGPSSSGKTSTSQRLGIQLAVNGIMPITVSMDDYYKNRVDSPKKPDGSYDFECLEAIDLDLFNDHMTKLMAGECVEMPKYNFKSGQREYRGKKLQLADNAVLIVEGIHGLNDKLTASIPAEKKMKIYVSELTPLSLDEHNRINTTDVRLLRRIVRDNQFRSHDALATLQQWDNVRDGEDKYIFPFQNGADVIFNTKLIYELSVLKKYAVPLLEQVPRDSGHAYMLARRLLELLVFFKAIPEEAIPNNSLMREFIGGSIFKEAL